MKIRHILLSLLLLYSVSVSAQEVSLVPLPASIETAEGNFIFGKKLTIKTAGYAADSLQTVVNDFAETFEKAIEKTKLIFGENKEYAIGCRNASMAFEVLGNKEKADFYKNTANEILAKLG